MNNRKIGNSYEKIAGEYLRLHGYEILEYSFRCKAGEIDIIAKDGDYLVFCEVKYRKSKRKGSPFEAVTIEKQKKISKTAMYYIATKEQKEIPCRFDVIGILGNQIQIVKNAFEYIG